MSAILNWFRTLIHFVRYDIWRLTEEELSGRTNFFVRQIKTLLLAARGFGEDRIHTKASALTYYSMLAVVPVLALILGIARGFGLQQFVERSLYENMAGQKELVKQFFDFADSYLAQTKEGMILGIGILVLLWSVINVLTQIENAFNEIWQVQGRPMLRRFTDYLSLVFILPLLMLLSSGLTVFVTTQLRELSQGWVLAGYIDPFLVAVVKFSPYVLNWVLFTLVYLVMPNTRVRLSGAFLAGVVGGSLFQLLQFFYFNSQVMVSKYNAIYGSFAALPLFLIWLQLSWIIVLFGAEISFAFQNVRNYEFEKESKSISPEYKRLLTLLVSYKVIAAFRDEKAPPLSEEIAEAYRLPIRLVGKVLKELVEAGILIETNHVKEKDVGYLPAMDISRLSLSYVIRKLDDHGSSDFKVLEDPTYCKIKELANKINQAMQNAGQDALLKDL